MTGTPGALVVGGDYRGLGLVRSLGRRGIPVWVAQADDLLAGASRYASRRLRWPRGSEEQQVDFLVELARLYGLQGWVLFPTSDTTASLMSRYHEVLETCYSTTTPPWSIYSTALDKRIAYARAEAVGIGVPRTWLTESWRDVEALDVTFPVVLKPAFGTSPNAFTVAKAWRASDRDELMARYAEALGHVPAGCVLVQELIPGGGENQLSFAGVCRDGEILAYVTARRTRQIPVDFGRLSTFVETIDRPDVVVCAARLLTELKLSGLVEVEFKQDPRDGTIKLLDVNARVWGWHSIGAAAGVDFAYLAWCLAQGLEVPRLEGRAGVRWVRLSMDLLVTAPEILARRWSLRSYADTLRRPRTGPIAARDDVVPGLAEIPILAWRTLGRAASRGRQPHLDRRCSTNRAQPAGRRPR